MLSGLSRRRRVFAVALIGALAVAVLVGLARVVAGSRAVSRLGTPQDRPGPVLLVPGYGGGVSAFDVLARRLRTAGRQVVVVRLPGDGTGDLEQSARAVQTAAGQVLAAGAPSVDLVGFSAGGVVARLWASDFEGAARARRIVTLGSPHHGTSVAALAGFLVPGGCTAACRQLEPGSALLRRLNAGDETPEGPAWLSLWTTSDSIVQPPESARLAGAVDVPLQSVCPDERVDHGGLPRDPLAVGVVLAAIGAGPVPVPRPADCLRLRRLGGG